MKRLKSLRILLIIWYIGSLIILSVFFYLVVHILAVPYGTEYFILLFILLAVLGFFIIFYITRSLTYLSSRIKLISSKNLSERIQNIGGENEIGELARSFNNLLDRLDDAFKRERQLITDVAHELKTPSATLQSGVEVALSKNRTKEEYKEALEEALIDAQRQSKTLNNILDLAWSDSNNADDITKPVNLSELLLEVYEVIYKLAKRKEITIEKTFDTNVYVVGIGSKDKLARAFLNILENAVKYTSRKGKIHILLKKEHHHAKIQVNDTGMGITEKDLPHIFERFYRGESTDKTFGSGLGMAITQSIIHSHKGKIKVKSIDGKGTTVIVILPSINTLA
ncbi:HAMP domain-containing protein [Patescibacteria group bacterium]|nr:HAMP domain-containing protein [Patescibacteria group bacterium]MBU4016615.1 HAMP domain-containing protein [Patescibacteria group bacterium]MBU4098376.1 HAMP domain-containing protein [Patescibacteria group bacterium]